MSEAPRSKEPDPRRTLHLYTPTWWEERFPWLLDLLIKLDPEPLGDRLTLLTAPVAVVLEHACRGPAAGLERLGSLWRTAWGGLDSATTGLLRALPLPSAVRDALWLRPHPLAVEGATTAHSLWRAQHRAVLPLAFLAAVVIHLATLLLWPTMGVEDLSSATAELEAVELPPQVEIPPPPEQLVRPAVPVIATTVIDEDITISPTTFEDNPVEALPPPPTEEKVVESNGPTFTPFTVAPEILNVPEVRALLITEYPPLLRDAGVGGDIVMWFYIDDEGGVIDMRIAKGSGYEDLDAAALRVAERIRFSPALNRDENVAVWVQFPIVFTVR